MQIKKIIVNEIPQRCEECMFGYPDCDGVYYCMIGDDCLLEKEENENKKDNC